MGVSGEWSKITQAKDTGILERSIHTCLVGCYLPTNLETSFWNWWRLQVPGKTTVGTSLILKIRTFYSVLSFIHETIYVILRLDSVQSLASKSLELPPQIGQRQDCCPACLNLNDLERLWPLEKGGHCLPEGSSDGCKEAHPWAGFCRGWRWAFQSELPKHKKITLSSQ